MIDILQEDTGSSRLNSILVMLKDGPKTPNQCNATVREFLALVQPNFIRPVEGQKTILTSPDNQWQITPLGMAHLKSQFQESIGIPRKRKRPSTETKVSERLNKGRL